MQYTDYGVVGLLQLRLFLCVFLTVVEGPENGLVHMLRAWSAT